MSGPNVIIQRPRCKAVLLTPTLYFRLPETDDSIALALQAFEDRYGHGIIRRMPSVTRTLVDRSRNESVWFAQQAYDAEYHIFVDHDMFYPTGDVNYWRAVTKTTLPDRFGKINFFDRILSHGPEIEVVGGLYKDKKSGTEYQTNKGHNERGWNDRMDRGEFRGLIADKWVATGAMRISTKLTRDMLDLAKTKFPEMLSEDYKKAPGYFARKHHQVGEDVEFCRRVADMGRQVWVDCDIRCFHAMVSWV